MRRWPWLVLLVCACLGAVTRAQERPLTASDTLAHDILRELIEIDTTNEHGSTTPAAEAVARRLQAAGLPAADIKVLGPTPTKANVVARLRGTGAKRPILLLAHLDVVEARREDWTTDPFKFVEKDGYFYGRGTQDVKDGAAILVANMIRLAQEHYRPERDLILALTADEEGGTANGVDWLVADHRELIDAEFCLNMDGGDFTSVNGRRISGSIQAAEKTYADFTLEVTNKGGHSSVPPPDNAIYHLAAGLTRLSTFAFPARLNEVTRGLFARRAALESGQLAADMKAVTTDPPSPEAVARLSADPYLNALMRTTCVATLLSAGHAANALPQRAKANVNCRMLPDEKRDDVQATLVRVLNDPAISVTPDSRRDNQPSPLRPDVVSAVEQVTAANYPGVVIIPTMETGATDGRRLRASGIPTYGVSGIFIDDGDDRQHGRDERLRAKDFYDALRFNYQLVQALSR